MGSGTMPKRLHNPFRDFILIISFYIEKSKTLVVVGEYLIVWLGFGK